MKLVKTPERRAQETIPMQYPTTIEIEQSLKRFAEEIGDTTESPFRVDLVARYGGKPPLYTVMIRCAGEGADSTQAESGAPHRPRSK